MLHVFGRLYAGRRKWGRLEPLRTGLQAKHPAAQPTLMLPKRNKRPQETDGKSWGGSVTNNSRSPGVAVNSQPSDVSQQRADEIDLFELAQQLWREKILIALITLAVSVVAGAYAFITPPKFASQIILSSAPIGLYGELMARMQDQKTMLRTEISPIALGRKLSSDAFGLLGSNLESMRNRQRFILGTPERQGVSVSITQDRKNPEMLTLSATGPDAVAVQEFLNQYLAFVAERTRAELNTYFNLSLNTDQLITVEMLYSLEQPAVVNSKPVKPRVLLILALGFVLGGMLGVFVALVRGVFKKQKQRV